MRILHFSDAHANANLQKYTKSLNQIKDYLKNNRVNLILFGMDLFDSRIHLSGDADYILRSFADLSNYAPIITGYGTPSHDFKNSLDLLPELAGTYPIIVRDTIDNTAFWVASDARIKKLDIIKDKVPEDHGCVVFVVPWLMRSRILDSDEMKLPPKEQEELFKEKFEKWVKAHEKFKVNCKIPVLMVGHLQLAGSVFSTSQDISSSNHDPEWFYDTCDIGCLGHVHRAQNFKNLYYAGSIYNKNFGEMEDKFFNIFEW